MRQLVGRERNENAPYQPPVACYRQPIMDPYQFIYNPGVQYYYVPVQLPPEAQRDPHVIQVIQPGQNGQQVRGFMLT